MCPFKLRSKILNIFVFLILTSTLFGQGMLSGVVLCIGGSDHVALEPFHNTSHRPNSNSSTDKTSHASMSHVAAFGSLYSSCYDIPVLIEFSIQNISTVRHLPYKAKTFAYSASASLPNLCTQAFYNKVLPKTSSLLTSTVTSLQTTILLI